MTADKIEAAPLRDALTVLRTDPVEAGKGGEAGVLQITNAEFIAAVFRTLPEGAFVAGTYPPPCHRGKSLNLWGYGQR